MIVTYNWLKEFVDFDLTPEELSHRLTMTGLEVDAMEILGEGLDSVIVAKLESVDPHPGADRLTVCQVNNGTETVQVVCGATNHKTGDLVAFAQVGSVLPGDFKIKKSKIRGEVSMGMLCSEKELALADESPGIMILPAGLPLGKPAFEALGLKDVRFELGLTPNRADCLSVVGVAREVSAMVGRPLTFPGINVEEKGEAIEQDTSVTIEEPGLCPRYAARLVKGVKIGPSPEWMVRRLEAAGMRSINNVVDVTNYVLMELGHPLHAFDFNLLRGRRIVVKRAGDNEAFTTLDSQVRQLSSQDLTICDAEGAVALAGVMGGENSEINDDTVDILLESAYFNPTTIRRTSKKLGIHSESSHRFERGADIDIVPIALNRAAALIVEVAGGTVAKGMIDAYPQTLARKKLKIGARKTADVLGIDIDINEIQRLLRGIGLDAVVADGYPEPTLHVEVPSFRHDLEREIDLVEEVARLNGYDQIPVTMPQSRVICHRPTAAQKLQQQVRDAVVAAGFSEIISYSFVNPILWDRLSLPTDDERRQTVKILNPLSEDQSVMRTTLVASVLENVSRNLAYRSRDLRIFELRPVFKVVAGEELPQESLRLTLAMCGRREPEGWSQSSAQADFYDLKGIFEDLAAQLNLKDLNFLQDEVEPYLHPGKSCQIRKGKTCLGMMGEVHPRVQESFDIDCPVYLLDLDLAAVFSAVDSHPGFKPISRFPDVYRDSAFLVDEDVMAQRVLDVVQAARNPHVEQVVLFDLYRGKGVPEGKKSLAIRVRYRSMDKTLTDDEISKYHGKIIQRLQNELNIELR